MKGVIQSDHMPTNRYQLTFLGVPELTPTEISGLEDELNTTELPDRTRASGGNRGPSEFTMMIPAHHTVERAGCEVWYIEGQDPVSPVYKKIGTLVHQSLSGQGSASYTLVGAFITKRKLPDLELANEGEMAVIEYTISVDDIIPI